MSDIKELEIEIRNWSEMMSHRDKKRLLEIMNYHDMTGEPSEYSCADDLLIELIWKLCI